MAELKRQLNMVVLDSLEEELFEARLSKLKAAKLAGISRTTLDKACRGEPVRKLTALSLKRVIMLAQNDFSFSGADNGEGSAEISAISSSAIEQLPGTTRLQSISELESEAVRVSSQLDDVLRVLVNRVALENSLISKFEYNLLSFKGRVVCGHFDELTRFRVRLGQL